MSDELNNTNDPVFVEEQEHLREIYQYLTNLRDELTALIEDTDSKAAHDLRELSEEIRPDFGGAADEVMETLAAIETLNAVIDVYNQYHDLSLEKLRRVLLLLRQPYFAKVRVRLSPDRPALDVYIGAAGITDDDSMPLIVDWRNPIAETYYNQENGHTTYFVNGKKREADLELRRQFDIDRDKLIMYFDTTVAIEDSLLLNALRRHHSEKLKDITATIQREQNAVVRHDDVPVLLVNGIAGSGKTSVMLQRIAYLLYQERERLSPNQVYLFGPNAVFEHYIDNVLPSMGEANPQVFTWRAFCEARGVTGRNLGVDTPVSDLKVLEDNLGTLSFQTEDFAEIRFNNTLLIKSSAVASAAKRYMKYGIGPRFTALLSDALHERLNSAIYSMSLEEEYQEKMRELTIEEQTDYFGDVVDPKNDREVREYTNRWLDQVFADAHTLIDNLAWLRMDRVAMRMLNKQSVSAAELMYLRLLLTGHGDDKARYIMIDEVQDYTLTQLTVLARFFKRAHFLMLGDEHQAIKEGTATFPEIKELFENSFGSVDECRLLTSYRSSPEITELFTSLVDHSTPIKLASVQREGVAPVIEQIAEKEPYLERLRTLVDDAKTHEDELCAIVCADEGAVSWYAKQLDEGVQVIKNDQELPATGIVLLSLRLAKGLEFDEVIIPDASAQNYPDTALARRQLYTAISRAMHKVCILAQGELTPLLKR